MYTSLSDDARGFSLIELLLTIAIIGVLATTVVPQLLRAHERTRQQATVADMRSIAGAAGTYHVDMGMYPSSLADLESTYMNPVPPSDGWGNAWAFTSDGATYTLSSLGLDGASGPAPPSSWFDEPFEVDLVVTNGAFTQAPSGR